MSTAEIERAIAQLPPEDLARFRHWFAEFDAVSWDRQLDRDVARGKLDAIGEEALADHRQGRSKDL